MAMKVERILLESPIQTIKLLLRIEWEVDADDYVTKIVETSGDETGKYGTTYTFTYENIE